MKVYFKPPTTLKVVAATVMTGGRLGKVPTIIISEAQFWYFGRVVS